MLGNLIDRFVGIFAPMAGFQRSIARAELRAFQAAAKDRKNADWVAKNQSADLAIVTDAATLNARSRQMMRDSHIAKAIKLSKVRNIVGRGITPIPIATDPAGKELVELNRAAEKGFWDWANDPARCDVEGRRNFWAMQALAVGEKVEVGQVFFVKCYTPGIGLQLRAYETEQLDNTITQCGDNEVRGGIEVDAMGRAVAYHFFTRNPNDLYNRRDFKSQRILRERVIHYFRPERVMQTHGVTELAPVLQRIRDVHKRDDAELWTAYMEACHGISVIQKNAWGANGPGLPRPPGDTTGTTPTGSPKYEFAPGMVFRGQPGDEVKFHAPTRPGGTFEPYNKVNLRGIGAGVDLSYEQVNRDFSQGTYSSQRQTLLEDLRAWRPDQDHLSDTLVQPCYEAWYWFDVVDGRLPLSQMAFSADPKRYTEAEYAPDGHDWIDPKTELEGYETALRLFLTTRAKIAGARGDRINKIFDQRKAETEAAAARGLTLPEDLPVPGAAAPPSPATGPNPATPASPTAPAGAKPGEALVAADGTPEAGVVTDQTLNGAQITAAVDVMNRTRIGELVESVAIELLVSLGFPREKAQAMVKAELAAPKPPPASPPASSSPQ
jgi:lambda family phage portal protein